MTATQLSRRQLLKAVGSGTVVVGFDILSRSWITEAHAAPGPDNRHKPPRFDGQFLVDAASLAAAADDYGHIVSRTPIAVLRPASADDVVDAVKYARKLGVKVAARGQGHSTAGHAQVAGGIVIDMSSLARIHSVNATAADVDGGVLWSELVLSAQTAGSTPPVTTDYIELSIGGTLAMGGVGARSTVHGFQVDNVLELQVVTGKGQLFWCSPTRKSELFAAALGTLGQFAIIVRARLRMVPAPSQARFYVLPYTDLQTFTDDQVRLIRDGRFDGIQGAVLASPGGGWSFAIEATRLFNAGSPPEDATLLDGLRYVPGQQTITDMPYFDWVNRLGPTIDFLKAIGVWGFPHPWFDVFLPASATVSYMTSVLANLTEEDTGQGPVLLRPFLRSDVRAQYVALPDEEVVFLFDILRTAPPVPAVVQQMVAHNRALFEQARTAGGKVYPMCSVPHSQADWRQHYGRLFPYLQAAKEAWDPQHVLTPGPGIFG